LTIRSKWHRESPRRTSKSSVVVFPHQGAAEAVFTPLQGVTALFPFPDVSRLAISRLLSRCIGPSVFPIGAKAPRNMHMRVDPTRHYRHASTVISDRTSLWIDTDDLSSLDHDPRVMQHTPLSIKHSARGNNYR